jgi:hypothetical protein
MLLMQCMMGRGIGPLVLLPASCPTQLLLWTLCVLATGLPRLDLLAQISEVEARQEEYSESIAFISLINRY